MDESHDVGVLLDGPRFAQVRKLGAFRTAAQLRSTAQLREGDDRHVQLLGDGLQRAGDESHLLFAVALRILRSAGHQLQIVDDDDLDVVVYLQTPGFRAEFEDRQRRRIVDVKGGRPQRLGRRLQVAPLLGRKTAALDIVARNTRFGDDKAHHQLHRRHLEREERHRTFVIDGHVAGHRQHEGGLTHRRACRHDDEVRQLPAERHAVDGHETRRHAVEGRRVLGCLLDLHQRLGQQILGRLYRTLDVTFGHLEDFALGIADQLRHVSRFVVRTALDLGRGADQLPLHVLLGDDFGVELHVGRRAHLLRELRQVRRTAHLLQLLADLQPLGDRIEVDRFEFGRELLDRAVDRPMLFGIESLGRDELLHGDDRILLEHQSAEHRLLQFDGLRRHVAGGIGHCSERFAVARSGGIFFSHSLRGFQLSKIDKRGDISKRPGPRFVEKSVYNRTIPGRGFSRAGKMSIKRSFLSILFYGPFGQQKAPTRIGTHTSSTMPCRMASGTRSLPE